MRTLFHLAHEHVDFRIPEIKSIAKIFGLNLKVSSSHNKENPFLVVDVPSKELVIKITKRSVLIKSAIELLAEADTHPNLLKKISNLHPSTADHASFRIKIDSFNRTLTNEQKISLIEDLTSSGLDFKGKVVLNDTSHTTYHLLEYYQRHQLQPQNVYFGKWICDGHRDIVKKYDLKKRKFIGNTSMDVTLSLIMANMAMARESSLAYDPFVGSGSLLVSCAHFGSYVMGSEIDFNLLMGVGKSSRYGQKWRRKDESIRNNLHQYQLGHKFLDVFLADAAQLESLYRRKIKEDGSFLSSAPTLFDAIITDPPYGIREPTQKLGFKTEPSEDFTIAEEHRDLHIPCKKSYHLGDLLADLMTFAAKYLCIGGRLVYWMPVYKRDYTDANIPTHKCLELVSNCEQSLNASVSRRMITMSKISHYEETDGQASAEADHYAVASFRHKYFKSPSNNNNDDVKS